MDEQIHKATLLARMEEQRLALENFLGGLSEAEMTASSTPTHWSIKDQLAHLAVWAKGMVALLRQEPRWEAMGLSQEFIDQNDDVDEMNAAIYEQQKHLSLAEARTFLDEVYQELVGILNGLTDEDLFKPYAHYQPQAEGDPDDKRPILAWLVGNTYEHYAEHLPWMKATLAEAREPKSRLV